MESVLAVIRPASSDYLYFLAKPGDGTLVLAKTFEEHERNVARYLR
jgi:cell division protein YceG involved in septum cleavage